MAPDTVAFLCLVLLLVTAANEVPTTRSDGSHWFPTRAKPNIARQITQKVVRKGRLYSFCSDLHVQCGPLSSNAKKTSPEGELLFETLMKHGSLRIRIKCLYFNKYICFNKEGNLVERKMPKGGRCDFVEEQPGGHFQYKSIEDASFVLGFSRQGEPLNTTDYWNPRYENCFKFLKLDSLLQPLNLWNWDIL